MTTPFSTPREINRAAMEQCLRLLRPFTSHGHALHVSVWREPCETVDDVIVRFDRDPLLTRARMIEGRRNPSTVRTLSGRHGTTNVSVVAEPCAQDLRIDHVSFVAREIAAILSDEKSFATKRTSGGREAEAPCRERKITAKPLPVVLAETGQEFYERSMAHLNYLRNKKHRGDR